MSDFSAQVATFKRYRFLLRNLVKRDITVKYRRSVLGIVWSILNPLLMMLIMTLVFSTLFSATAGELQTVRATGQPPDFAVYLLSGQLIINFFSEATQLAMDSILSNAPLIKKVYVPKYIFPLEKVIFSFTNTVFSLIALLLVMLLTGSPLSGWALLFWVPLVLLALFNLGVGLLLSALTVFFRDIKHFYGVLVMALTYLTPIFYTEEIFAKNPQMAEIMFYVLRANPLFWFVSMFRRVMVYGYAPTLYQWAACGAWALVALAIGLFTFKKTQDKFILYV